MKEVNVGVINIFSGGLGTGNMGLQRRGSRRGSWIRLLIRNHLKATHCKG